MTSIITIQHCQSEHHVNKMIGGVTDWALTERGKEQADTIGKALKEKLEDASDYILYSSDLMRAKQTADIVAKHLNIKPVYRRELREINLGSATGRSLEWLQANQIPRPENLPWIYHKVLPDAESAEDVFFRVSKLAEEIENSADGDYIIVGHSCSLSMFTARWLKLPVSALEKTAFSGSAGGVSFMSERDDGSRVLNVWNNTSYMIPSKR